MTKEGYPHPRLDAVNFGGVLQLLANTTNKRFHNFDSGRQSFHLLVIHCHMSYSDGNRYLQSP
jgi:hypothetical protein